MKKRPIGIGMIGCGWMCKAHSNAYITSRYMNWTNCDYEPVLKIVGGQDAEEGREAAQRFGFERFTSGWHDIVTASDVLIVDNVTPDHLHMQPSIEAAQNGKHVICEKPLAVEPADAKKMLEAVNEAGVKHACGFIYRMFPAIQYAKELIANGEIGKIYHFTGKYYQEQGRDPSTPVEDVWYINWSGIGQGITSHMIDMSRFLVGEIDEVIGMTKTYNNIRDSKKGPVEVTADEGFFSLVNFHNGASGIYDSLGVGTGKGSEFSFEIFGTKGSITWNVLYPNDLNLCLKDTKNPTEHGYTNINITDPSHPLMNMWWPKGHNLGWEHGHINLITHFLDCVANDKSVGPMAGTFDDGYKVSVIIRAIMESAKTGQKVPIVY